MQRYAVRQDEGASSCVIGWFFGDCLLGLLDHDVVVDGDVDGGVIAVRPRSTVDNSHLNLSSGVRARHSMIFGYRAGKIMGHNDDPDYELDIPITY